VNVLKKGHVYTDVHVHILHASTVVRTQMLKIDLFAYCGPWLRTRIVTVRKSSVYKLSQCTAVLIDY